MTINTRKHALEVLEQWTSATSTVLHNAVIDLRRDAGMGDDKLLTPVLQHDDPMVVAAVLYTLCEVHEQRNKFRPLIEQLAKGDRRDDAEMPIQCTAISLLSTFGHRDKNAVRTLLTVAENPAIAEAPCKRAWQELADMHDIPWSREDSDELMANPNSRASLEIRNRVKTLIFADK